MAKKNALKQISNRCMRETKKSLKVNMKKKSRNKPEDEKVPSFLKETTVFGGNHGNNINVSPFKFDLLEREKTL